MCMHVKSEGVINFLELHKITRYSANGQKVMLNVSNRVILTAMECETSQKSGQQWSERIK